MTITPEKLRSLADAQMGVAVVPDEARMLADAMQLADEFAWVDIECNCGSPDWAATPKWYNTADFDELMRAEEMALNVRYLDARGLLEHHPEHNEWVRLKVVT